jgi:hypothetical protein
MHKLESLKEFFHWSVRGPLYAAGMTFFILAVAITPLMLELPVQSPRAAVTQNILDIAFIWIGIPVVGAGYALLIATPPRNNNRHGESALDELAAA